MKCPVCEATDLIMTERQGVEIDYCPKCRGVWLDRGELDKIIERSSPQQEKTQPVMREPYRQDSGHDREEYHHDKHYTGHKRHKSWLQEIFD
ncbi:MAG: zf-TFIIB domain-containing protein [Pseudomonadota bacterium]